MAVSAVTPEFHREWVLVGQAAIRLFPLDPTNPTAPSLPTDTVELNGSWGPGWVPIGATEEGVTLNFSRSTENITVEESQVPVDVRTTELTFTVGCSLSEDTMETMRIAFGGGTITTTPATETTPGVKRLQVSPELDQFALGAEGRNEFGKPRRILIPIVLSVADAEVQYRRAAAPRRYSVSFQSLIDIQSCEFRDIIAAPLGTGAGS